jgi:hypothetical protein
MKWMLLVLTLGGGDGAIATEGVGPFDSELLCTKAASVVMGRINETFGTKADWACVQTALERPAGE